jgi:hypothetical protein
VPQRARTPAPGERRALSDERPRNRYGNVLFVEKQGFDELFAEVQLAARYDIAIMSTKGMSVTASRALLDRLAAKVE